MIKAIAIDDEPIALNIIKEHQEKIPFLEIIEFFTNPIQAISYLEKNQVDLIFLDIKMPDISGIDLLKSLTHKPLVIFTTAYPEHALDGFELDAVDYLLKPFEFMRFLKAVNKVQKILSPETITESVFVKNGYDYERINISDILYLEAAGNYIKFVKKEYEILSRMTMSEIEELVKNTSLIRIHRSFYANTKHIQKVEKHQVIIRDYKIPIGATYFPEVKEWVESQ
jgi:two-component system, LytTR family, response regulator